MKIDPEVKEMAKFSVIGGGLSFLGCAGLIVLVGGFFWLMASGALWFIRELHDIFK